MSDNLKTFAAPADDPARLLSFEDGYSWAETEITPEDRAAMYRVMGESSKKKK